MIYKMNTELNFGKYKHKTVEEVLENDPGYLEWALENIEWFELDNEVTNKLWPNYEDDCNWADGYDLFMWGGD